MTKALEEWALEPNFERWDIGQRGGPGTRNAGAAWNGRQMVGRDRDRRARGPAPDGSEVSRPLRQSRGQSGRHGGLRRRSALGAPAGGVGSRGPLAAGKDGPTVRERQQGRHPRRAGDMDGGSATRGQDGRREDRGAAGNPGPAPHASAVGEVPNGPDQLPARSGPNTAK